MLQCSDSLYPSPPLSRFFPFSLYRGSYRPARVHALPTEFLELRFVVAVVIGILQTHTEISQAMRTPDVKSNLHGQKDRGSL